MLNAIPEQYHLFLGIGGMVFVMLFVVSAAQKYQAYQYEKEMTIRRMLRAVKDIEHFVAQVDGCPIPKKILVSLNKEIFARYVTIRHINRKVENIDLTVGRAQQSLESIESRGETPYSVPNNRQLLDQYVAGLTGMINYLHNERSVTGMNVTEKQQYQNDLSTIRAQLVFDYNIAEAKAVAGEGLWHDAGKYIRSVMGFIQSHGPTTDEANKLYHKANHHYKQVMVKQIPSEEALMPPQPVMTEPDSEEANPNFGNI